MIASIICPIYNGASTLERTVRSVLSQSHPDWELILVDDQSTDSTYDAICKFATMDSRIRAYRSPENLGPSAARNIGLSQANGDLICFIDCDDEYYKNYLQKACHFIKYGDVLVFGYDYINDDNSLEIGSWEPTPHRDNLFLANFSTPLGVAHRRLGHTQQIGFEEGLWCLEDWEYWKQLARMGLEFLFLPVKSGLYHIRKESRSRKPRITQSQKAQYEINRQGSQSLYKITSQHTRSTAGRRYLVAIPRFILDHPSALSDLLLDLLSVVASDHYEVECFMYWNNDQIINTNIDHMIGMLGLDCKKSYVTVGNQCCIVYNTAYNGVPITILRHYEHTPYVTFPFQIEVMLVYFCAFLARYQPTGLIALFCDQSLDPIGHAMLSRAKQRDAIVLYYLGNDLLPGLNNSLLDIDCCVVTSRFSERHHWEKLALNCAVLPPAIDPDRALGRDDSRREYIVYYSPSCYNGLRIVKELARRLSASGSGAQLLIVELPDQEPWMRDWNGADEIALENVKVVTRTYNMREIWSRAKLVLNLYPGDDQPLSMLLEAMINDVPTISVERGAVGELLGDACKFVPYTAAIPYPKGEACLSPSHEELVTNLISAITENCNNEHEYTHWVGQCAKNSESFKNGGVREAYREFLLRLSTQPGPPLLPSVENGSTT